MCIPGKKLKLDAVESKKLSSNSLFVVQISNMGRVFQNVSMG